MRGVLCSRCSRILTGFKHENNHKRKLIGPPPLLIESFKALCGGTDAGCFICTQVNQKLLSNAEWNDLKFRSTRYLFEDFGVPGLLNIYMEWEHSRGVMNDCLTLRMMPVRPGVDPSEISLTLGRDLASERTIELMQTWLSTCLSCHDGCSLNVGNAIKPQLPTRLLDVGDSRAQLCRLQLTSSGSLDCISEGYLTLSHRWNESNFLKLNSSNMDHMLEGIPISTLPRCFRDAVFLAHKFGVRYLWIDSLCIKQDSEEDWGREAPRMKDVYGGAVVNIVAGHSTGPEDSLFHTKDRLFAQSAIIRSEWKYTRSSDNIIWNHTNIKQDFESAPLTRRGWVFQELMLAPRTLQFGKTQVYWRCSKLFACESLPHGASSPEGEAVTYGTDLKELKVATFYGPDYVAWLWKDILVKYSRCKLTFCKDKLVALSGIAERFQEFTADRYCAGLWWSSMIEFLSWRRDSWARKPAKPRPEYCAPTWSWASIDEPMDFRDHGPVYQGTFWSLELADAVDAHPIVPRDGDCAEQVKDAIRIRGSLHSFVILFDGDEGLHCKIDGETRAGGDQFTPDIALQSPENTELWILPTLLRSLASRTGSHLFPEEDLVLEGLVLMKSEDPTGTSRDGESYKRVGHFRSRKMTVGIKDKAFKIQTFEEESEDGIFDEESFFEGVGAGEDDANGDGPEEGKVEEEEPDWNDYEDVPTGRYFKLRRRRGAWTEIEIV